MNTAGTATLENKLFHAAATTAATAAKVLGLDLADAMRAFVERLQGNTGPTPRLNREQRRFIRRLQRKPGDLQRKRKRR